mgnify:CR=1 FL=1
MNKYKLVINIFYKKILTKEGEITYGERNKSSFNCSRSFSNNYNHFSRCICSIFGSKPNERSRKWIKWRRNSIIQFYEGTSVSGTKVKALVDAVYNHNLTESDESRKIELVDGTNATILAKEQEDPTQKPAIKTGKRYSVTCVPEKKSGLITKIQIQILEDN